MNSETFKNAEASVTKKMNFSDLDPRYFGETGTKVSATTEKNVLRVAGSLGSNLAGS